MTEPPPALTFCGTPLTPTSYKELSTFLYNHKSTRGAKIIDFTNTHIITSRLIDQEFRAITESVDFFIPDSMPLTWCVNAAAGKTIMQDRVYGPKFMQVCLDNSPAELRHYFLGASQQCLEDLLANLRSRNPSLTIAGSHHGYFNEEAYENVLEAIKQSQPDLVWIGLGTPKQQAFSNWAKSKLPSGWLLNVGFAFDVNAGWKPDAPRWMQRLGLTWLFRMLSEPRRLVPRYLKYNSLFLICAAEWFLTNKLLLATDLFKRVAFLLAGGFSLFFLYVFFRFPVSLFFLGSLIVSLGLAWMGIITAMAAADDFEEPHSLSKKLLNLGAFLGGVSAVSQTVLVPLFSFFVEPKILMILAGLLTLGSASALIALLISVILAFLSSSSFPSEQRQA